tara:strand:+ start:89 stop:589 length:501 start_codon:yes stop_codon:yes gene_type:complete
MNVEIGKIIGAVGIKGHLKLATYLSNRKNISKMNSVFFDEEKNLVKLNFIREHKGNIIISLKHIKSRNEAESLIGKKLFIKRESLPPLKHGEYYALDLIGFEVINSAGNKIGIVKDIKNFGAGNLFEINKENKKTFFIPFNKENISKIDQDRKKIIANPIKGIVND